MPQDDKTIDELERRRRKKAAEQQVEDKPAEADAPAESARPTRGRRSNTGEVARRPPAGEDDFNFRAGQNLICRVGRAEPGGYEVTVKRGNLLGFLPTEAELNSGDEILATFVCTVRDRLLLSCRPQNGEAEGAVVSLMVPASSAISGQAGLYYKRARDLFPPPNISSQPLIFRPVTSRAELIATLEEPQLSGILEVSNPSLRTRSTAVLYFGDVVGCIHGNAFSSALLPTEDSLDSMLKVLNDKGSEAVFYDYNHQIIAAMSALFLGYAANPKEMADVRPDQYIDTVCGWIEDHEQTACMTVTAGAAPYLAYFYEGRFIGGFSIGEQRVDETVDELYAFVGQDNVDISVHMLPRASVLNVLGFTMSERLANETP